MIARVDGQPVPPHTLGWPAMNFGQFRWDAPLGSYVLEIPREAFVERLHAAYERYAAELRADDLHDPDGVPHLREIGYPPLGVVLDHPRQFEELVRVFLYEDVFAAFLPPPSPAATFLLNSVDSATVSAELVVIRGRGYHLSPGSPGTR